jgi:Tfp pilus assembly protein PilN
MKLSNEEARTQRLDRWISWALIVVALIVVVAQVGCATLGVEAPKTFMQRAAAAQLTVTNARTSALDLLKAHKITPQQATKVQQDADFARSAIDEAVALHTVSAEAGEGKLDSVANTLRILRGVVAAAASLEGK